MVQNQTTNFRNFAAQLLLGSIALAPGTLAFFRLDVDLASIAVAYLIVTVVLSPMGSFIASAVAAFLFTSSIVMRLIWSLRDGGKQWREFFHKADRLFNAFCTAKSSGVSMGLSTCPSIIDAHGGRMSASGNEKPVATLQLVLPLHQEDAS
jgi:nitrogen fixation/metabolism regulation signal transduction histidine kinase